MRSLFRLCNALAALIEEFAASGGVQILVDSWRSHAEESRSKARLADEKKLIAPAGLCAQIVITGLEGIVARFIRNEFKENPSSYLDNYWQILERSILK